MVSTSEYETTGISICIRDTGVGISTEKLCSVFRPFNKNVDNRSLNKYGVGLGLPISRNLAKALGGDIVASSVPDVGSTFTLQLRNVLMSLKSSSKSF